MRFIFKGVQKLQNNFRQNPRYSVQYQREKLYPKEWSSTSLSPSTRSFHEIPWLMVLREECSLPVSEPSSECLHPKVHPNTWNFLDEWMLCFQVKLELTSTCVRFLLLWYSIPGCSAVNWMAEERRYCLRESQTTHTTRRMYSGRINTGAEQSLTSSLLNCVKYIQSSRIKVPTSQSTWWVV